VTGAHGYLRLAWRSAHWRLYEVRAPQPLAFPPASVTAVSPQSFTLSVPAAGDYTVLIHWSPYWAITRGSGCVGRAGVDWTWVQARAAGTLHVAIDFSLARIFSHGNRCT
jgi:hypothetical protein